MQSEPKAILALRQVGLDVLRYSFWETLSLQSRQAFRESCHAFRLLSDICILKLFVTESDDVLTVFDTDWDLHHGGHCQATTCQKSLGSTLLNILPRLCSLQELLICCTSR
jgi:hypothetical protein